MLKFFKLTLSFIVFFYIIIGSSRFFSNKYDFYSSFNILEWNNIMILFIILVCFAISSSVLQDERIAIFRKKEVENEKNKMELFIKKIIREEIKNSID
jgi:hypothetical protein